MSIVAWSLFSLVGLARHAGAVEQEPCDPQQGDCPSIANGSCPMTACTSVPPAHCSDHPTACKAMAPGSCGLPVATDPSFCDGECWFSFVVLPDTQKLSREAPEIFDCQTQWIKTNQGRHNIAFVLHAGDIINEPDQSAQWSHAKKSMCTLTNASIPWLLSLGNMERETGADPYATAHQYFPLSTECAAGDPSCGSWDGTINFAYRDFDNLCGADWRALAVHFDPDLSDAGAGSARAWLRNLADSTKETRRILLVTHSFLDDTGIVMKEGKDLWKYFATDFPNISMIFNAHDHTSDPTPHVEQRSSTYFHAATTPTLPDNARPVWASFSNFQGVDNDDVLAGTLEVVNVCPKGNKVLITHFSPWSNQCFNDRYPLYESRYRRELGWNDGIDFSLKCGDGFVGHDQQNVLETCDDYNAASGDCCDASCHFEAANAPCDNDHNACTAGSCNGSGVCVEPCNQGVSCNPCGGVCGAPPDCRCQ